MLRHLLIFFACVASNASFALLPVPSLTGPTNNSTVSSFTANISLGISSGASGYQVQYDTANTFDSPMLDSASSPTRNFYTGHLRKGLKYYWRARATSATDISNWTATRSFTVYTKALQNTPANNATGPMTALVSQLAGTGVTYLFEVDTTNSFNSFRRMFYSTASEKLTDSNYFVFGKRYYWRVTAINSFGDTLQWSDTRWYNIYSKPTITNTGATADPERIVRWTTAGEAMVYLKADTSKTFSSGALIEHLLPANTLSDTLRKLFFGKKYYYLIRAVYGPAQSAWSDTASFTVNAGGTAVNPAHNSIYPYLIVNLQSSNMAGANKQIQIASDSLFTTIFGDSVLPYPMSFFRLKDSLDLKTRYFWRARYFHEEDTSEWTPWTFTVFGGQVNLSTPVNKATNIPVQNTFRFIRYDWATSYFLEIDTGTAFGIPSSFRYTVDTFTINSSIGYFNLKLNYGTNYVWRVYAIRGDDTADASTPFTFTTAFRPTPYYPYNNYIGVGTQTNGLVTGIVGSDSIEWQLDTTELFNSPEFSSGKDQHIPDDFSPQYVGINLPGDRLFHAKYFWRTRCMTDRDTSDWSDVFNFSTTQDVWANSPSDKATGVDVPTNLQWGIQGSASDYTYQYQVGLDSNFASMPVKSVPQGDSPEAMYNTAFNTRYYWRARALHSRDTSRWSKTFSFITEQAPVIPRPQLASPPHGTINVPLTPLDMFWYSVADADYYEIQVSYDINFNSIITSAQPVGNGVVFSGLQPNEKYFWRVKTIIDGLESPWSSVWSFQTIKTTGVETISHNTLLVYPNPAATALYISASEVGIGEVTIFSMDGKRVYTGAGTLQMDGSTRIDVSAFNPGIYVLEVVTSDKQVIRQKISIQ